MTPTAEDKAVNDRFARTYALGQSEVMRDIERAVCGCDYGGTSWTTRDEAEALLSLLALAPGRQLLEVGAGAGWPSLYLARRTGCDAALTDLPLEGLRIARERAASEGLAGAIWIVLAGGAALPFRDAWFDAVCHSDVLCCLFDKEEVLRACRRVVKAAGMMAFSVIFVPEGAPTADRERAKAAGPPFVETGRPYEALLEHTGWTVRKWTDLTPAFLAAARTHVSSVETRLGQVSDVYGPDDAEAMLARSRLRATAIESGSLQRVLIAAAPAAD